MATQIKRDDGWYDDTGQTIKFSCLLETNAHPDPWAEVLLGQTSEAIAEIANRVEARTPPSYFLLVESAFENPKDETKLGTEFVWRVFKKRSEPK